MRNSTLSFTVVFVLSYDSVIEQNTPSSLAWLILQMIRWKKKQCSSFCNLRTTCCLCFAYIGKSLREFPCLWYCSVCLQLGVCRHFCKKCFFFFQSLQWHWKSTKFRIPFSNLFYLMKLLFSSFEGKRYHIN